MPHEVVLDGGPVGAHGAGEGLFPSVHPEVSLQVTARRPLVRTQGAGKCLRYEFQGIVRRCEGAEDGGPEGGLVLWYLQLQ